MEPIFWGPPFWLITMEAPPHLGHTPPEQRNYRKYMKITNCTQENYRNYMGITNHVQIKYRKYMKITPTHNDTHLRVGYQVHSTAEY